MSPPYDDAMFQPIITGYFALIGSFGVLIASIACYLFVHNFLAAEMRDVLSEKFGARRTLKNREADTRPRGVKVFFRHVWRWPRAPAGSAPVSDPDDRANDQEHMGRVATCIFFILRGIFGVSKYWGEVLSEDVLASKPEGPEKVKLEAFFADKTFATLPKEHAEAHLHTTKVNLLKVVELIKLVTVFLLVITPFVVLDYQCALPKELMSKFDQTAFASTLKLPCDVPKFGALAYTTFVAGYNITGTALAQLESLQTLGCYSVAEAYLGVVLFMESLSLIVLLSVGIKVWEHTTVITVMLYISAVLWGAWPIILAFKYAGDYVCYVPYSVLTTIVFSVWHSIAALLVKVVDLVQLGVDGEVHTRSHNDWKSLAHFLEFGHFSQRVASAP